MALNAISNISNDKYHISLKVNGQSMHGYVDLGSQCTLLRRSIAEKLGLQWSTEQLPTMRGIGSNVVLPVGKTSVDRYSRYN